MYLYPKFDVFGGKGPTFSETEKEQLYLAAGMAVTCIANASILGNDFSKAQTWFGRQAGIQYQRIQECLQKMKELLNGAKTITFVDARGQVFMDIGDDMTIPVPGLPGRSGPRTIDYYPSTSPGKLSKRIYACVHLLSDDAMNRYGVTEGHYGSGFRLYIGPKMFAARTSDKDRAVTLLHELTHKVLNTQDHDEEEADCLEYARTNSCEECRDAGRNCSHPIVENADTWGYFLYSFWK